MPGFYRLDQCDEDGTPIEEAPPAYVEIESSRNAAPVGAVDPRDAIIRDLAQINADITRTMVERFSNVMQATADIMRAADGAGLPRREPPPPPSRRPAPDDEEDEEEDDDQDDDQDEDDDESEAVPPKNPFGPFQPLVERAMPHLPDFGAFLWTKFQEFWKQKGAPSPVTVPESAPAPAPGAPAAAPTSPGPEPGSASAAPSAAATSTAPAPQASWPPPPAPPPPPPVPSAHEVSVAGGPEEAGAAASSPSVAGPSPVTQPPGAAFSTPTALGEHPAAMASPPVAANGAISPAAASSTSPRLDAIPPSATTSDGTTAEGNPPRNAMATNEPMPEPWAHVRAVLARLSPREAAITETVIGRMSPEMRAKWLADLSALDVGQAVEDVRSMIPKRAPARSQTANPATDPGAPPKAEAVPATKPPTTEPSTAAATSTKTPAVPAKLPPLPPQAMGHFLAIQAALTPDEVAFLRTAVSGLSPLQLRALIEEYSAISVPEAVARIRALRAATSSPEAA